MHKNNSWNNQYFGIKCCKVCVPPKRHRACHDTCKEYKEEKEAFEIRKNQIKQEAYPRLTKYDFEEIHFVGSKNYKRTRRD